MAKPKPLTASDVARFDSKVIRSDDPDACWEWRGSRFTQTGYGQFAMRCEDERWRPTTAHRVAYEITKGPIPDGLLIDHLCRNRGCVNPAHLEAVTNKVNILRGESLQAQLARKTHCKNGHPFDEANTYRTKTGGRTCRTCVRAYNNARYHRLKGRVA